MSLGGRERRPQAGGGPQPGGERLPLAEGDAGRAGGRATMAGVLWGLSASAPTATVVDAAEALVAVAPLTTRWIERLLAGHDPRLTVPQYLALRAIAREGISGSELARRTDVSGPAVSQLLAGLVDSGLLERPER